MRRDIERKEYLIFVSNLYCFFCEGTETKVEIDITYSDYFSRDNIVKVGDVDISPLTRKAVEPELATIFHLEKVHGPAVFPGIVSLGVNLHTFSHISEGST